MFPLEGGNEELVPPHGKSSVQKNDSPSSRNPILRESKLKLESPDFEIWIWILVFQK
jgi:hypothetical protein